MLAGHLLFLSFCLFLFFSFCSLGFFKTNFVCEIIRKTFLQIPRLSFFSLQFLIKKNQLPKISPFFFCSVLFCFIIFAPFFLSSLSSLFTFSFHFLFISFCFSPLLLFSLVSVLSFSLSQCFFFFPFSCLFLSFFHRRFCPPSFCVNSLFSFLLFLISLIFSYFFLTLFSSTPHLFFLPTKIPKFSVVNFWDEIVFFFKNLPSSVFNLLLFPPCVVLIPCLFHVFFWFFAFLDVAFLDFLVSTFILGLFKKLSLCFWREYFKKILESSFYFFHNSLFFFCCQLFQ